MGVIVYATHFSFKACIIELGYKEDYNFQMNTKDTNKGNTVYKER